MRDVLFAVFAIAMRAQTLPGPTDVLAHARDNMVERAKRLPNYTCVQTYPAQALAPANGLRI